LPPIAKAGHSRYAIGMTSPPALRRLLALPGVADLEYKALMKREFADPEARAEYPEIDACSRELFGLTADEAEATPRPAGWDGIETRSPREQADVFEAEGWDVTDDKRRPLRVLPHFSQQLWLALRGVAGELPFQAETIETGGDWGKSLAADAARFRRR
jgi:hypothetical protein